MTRIQTACYALIGSAFVLSGLLLFSLGNQLNNPAYGELVIARENFSMMTTRTSSKDESLFVLDNTSGRLYVYTLKVSGGQSRLELGGGEDLNRIFRGSRGGGGRR